MIVDSIQKQKTDKKEFGIYLRDSRGFFLLTSDGKKIKVSA